MKPVSVEAFDIFSQGEISECDSCVNSDCESGKWSSALVSNDIRVPLSFADEVVLLQERKSKHLRDAEKEKQEGIHGQWQQETLVKKFLEQVKSSADTNCTPIWMLCDE